MLTIDEIRNAVAEVAPKYHVTKVTLFGSYANGTADDNSEIDLMVEFTTPSVSLLKIIALKHEIEDVVGVSVNVFHAPIPDSSLLMIDKELDIYAA